MNDTTDAPFDFFQQWSQGKDFWIELLAHLAPRAIFHLSCASRSMHSLAWKHLIPASRHGLVFHILTPAIIENYFSRTPSLSRLVFNTKLPVPVAELLTKITKLNALWLSDFPGQTTNTTSPLLSTFLQHLARDLQELHFKLACRSMPPTFPTLQSLTRLTSLQLSAPNAQYFQDISCLTNIQHLSLHSNPDFPSGCLSNLTNLQSFELQIQGMGDPRRELGITYRTPRPNPDLTLLGLCKGSLKSLKLHWIPSPPDIDSFTNLESLNCNAYHPGDTLRTLSLLPRLTSLKLMIDGELIPDVYLSNLTKLRLSTRNAHKPFPIADSLSCMQNLKWLDLAQFPIPPQITFLTSLEYLNVQVKVDSSDHSEDFLTHLTGLKALDWGIKPYHVLSGLSNLEDLSISTTCSPSDVAEFLTELTKLQTLSFRTAVKRTPKPSPKDLEPLSQLQNLHTVHFNCGPLSDHTTLVLEQNQWKMNSKQFQYGPGLPSSFRNQDRI